MNRNVILLTIDSLRQDSLGCLGRQPSITPNLDKIARRAVNFTQAIACGGWTRPSLTGLLSSTFPSMYGGSWGRFHEQRPSLAQTLQEQGLLTAAFISNPQIGTPYGFERGFDIFEEPGPTYPGPKWANVRGMRRVLQRPQAHYLLNSLGVKTAPPAITATAEELTKQFETWLAGGQSSPFFAWVHYMDTHWPYHISQELSSAKEIAQAWTDLQVMHVCSQHHGRLHPGAAQLQQVMEAYWRTVHYIDEQLGYLMKSLESLGLLDSTVIIITADHGEEFFEHGRWGHYQLHDENITVPLIMRLPELGDGVTINRQVSHIDLAPTIVDMLDLNKPDDMLGRSLLPLLDGIEGQSSPEIYVESMWSDNYRLAIRTENFKYIYEANLPDEPQLYNLQVDPSEQLNLWSQEPERARQFEELRLQHQARVDKTSQDLATADVEVDEEVLERLQALGYIE